MTACFISVYLFRRDWFNMHSAGFSVNGELGELNIYLPCPCSGSSRPRLNHFGPHLLISRRPLDVINYEDLNRAATRFKFQSKLLLDRSEDRCGTRLRRRCTWVVACCPWRLLRSEF